MVPAHDLTQKIICIIGLGYVGYPLAVAFSKKFRVIGFDINTKKTEYLQTHQSPFNVTSNPQDIKNADIFIITVPTPISKSKQPDLFCIKSASATVGRQMKKGSIVVLESTVYPSVTEDIVGTILEKESGLRLGKDFKIGYSPERVNPGDDNHSIDKITKIVAGIDNETTNILVELYGSITQVYKARNIKTAEAAKVIENIQRDINISLVNEFSLIFSKLGLDIKDIIDAASTKWNFHPYTPGLVGGHCIPVDPYYLVYKAKELGYHPQVILAGRSVNDNMPKHVVEQTIKTINKAGKIINGSNVLILGLTFKENVSDTRETPVLQIINGLKEYNCNIYGFDPLLSEDKIREFGIKPVLQLKDVEFNCIIITIIHDAFKEITLHELKNIMDDTPILIDIKRLFKRRDAEENNFLYVTL